MKAFNCDRKEASEKGENIYFLEDIQFYVRLLKKMSAGSNVENRIGKLIEIMKRADLRIPLVDPVTNKPSGFEAVSYDIKLLCLILIMELGGGFASSKGGFAVKLENRSNQIISAMLNGEISIFDAGRKHVSELVPVPALVKSLIMIDCIDDIEDFLEYLISRREKKGAAAYPMFAKTGVD